MNGNAPHFANPGSPLVTWETVEHQARKEHRMSTAAGTTATDHHEVERPGLRLLTPETTTGATRQLDGAKVLGQVLNDAKVQARRSHLHNAHSRDLCAAAAVPAARCLRFQAAHSSARAASASISIPSVSPRAKKTRARRVLPIASAF